MGEDDSQRGSWLVPSSKHPLFLSQLSPSADIAVAVFLLFTGVVSVLGNGTVLFVSYRRRKKLRPPELMTINLAICDFGFSLLGVPFFILSSLSHGWVFGEAGCLLYGIQGFVFGIGSLLTTSLISLDRCLKICCLRYGQWIEKRHICLSIMLMWVYTVFWATLPAFGFGSYGPEPYGTSCTLNWWRMRSSQNDRIYLFLVLTLCFGFPSLTIISSYLAILLTVYRSNRTLASIASSSVSHSSKDLRLAKMAAVVCTTFLAAWLPYAAVSLISALVPRDEAEDTLQTVMEESTGVASKLLDVSSLLNWSGTELYRQVSYSPGNKWSEAQNTSLSDTTFRSKLMSRNTQPLSSLPPVVTLIPAMLAKSHCMMNPLIYQIMNRQFRDDVYRMVFGEDMAKKRQPQGQKESSERSLSHSYCRSCRSKMSNLSYAESKNRNVTKEKKSSGADCWDSALNFTSYQDYQENKRDTATPVDRDVRREPQPE